MAVGEVETMRLWETVLASLCGDAAMSCAGVAIVQIFGLFLFGKVVKRRKEESKGG